MLEHQFHHEYQSEDQQRCADQTQGDTKKPAGRTPFVIALVRTWRSGLRNPAAVALAIIFIRESRSLLDGPREDDVRRRMVSALPLSHQERSARS